MTSSKGWQIIRAVGTVVILFFIIVGLVIWYASVKVGGVWY